MISLPQAAKLRSGEGRPIGRGGVSPRVTSERVAPHPSRCSLNARIDPPSPLRRFAAWGREKGERRCEIVLILFLTKFPSGAIHAPVLFARGRFHEAFWKRDRMRCPRPASQAGLGRLGATVPPHYEGELIGRLRRRRRTAGNPSGSTSSEARCHWPGDRRRAGVRQSGPPATSPAVARRKALRGSGLLAIQQARAASSPTQRALRRATSPHVWRGELLTPRTLRRRENERVWLFDIQR